MGLCSQFRGGDGGADHARVIAQCREANRDGKCQLCANGGEQSLALGGNTAANDHSLRRKGPTQAVDAVGNVFGVQFPDLLRYATIS